VSTPPSAALPPGTTQDHTVPSVNKWLITIAVMLAATMEVMDTSIANVALPHMQGSLSASTEEIAWVLTSYLVANAVVIPLGGWFSEIFGRRNFFSTCVLIFTAASAACGAAPNLQTLVFFRILQGAAGGALIPLSQAIMLETFPPREQGIAMAMWGVGIMFSPIIGPFVGGWITDSYSWRWIFYVNLPIGLLAFLLVGLFVHDPAYLRARRGKAASDWWGLGFLVVGIGALQVVLDQGERKDWLSSDLICWLTLFSLAGGCAFIVRELMTRDPLIDLRLFRSGTYSAGTLLMGAMGFVLYGAIVLLPLHAQNLLGYTAFEAGKIIAPGGMGTLITMPIAGALLARHDGRPIIIMGTLLLSWSLYLLSGQNLDSGYWQLAGPRFMMGLAFGCIFVPLSTTTMSGIRPERMNAASGFYNLARNIGGSIGIALVTTLLSRLGQLHQTLLTKHVNPYSVHAQEAIRYATRFLMSHGVDHSTAAHGALGLLYAEVQRQSLMNAFLDDYALLATMALVVTPLILFLRKASAASPPAAH
jgi:DHA2 family multidrug resistance protein